MDNVTYFSSIHVYILVLQIHIENALLYVEIINTFTNNLITVG